MDMEHEIPKKLGVLATHRYGEPPKTLDALYLTDIRRAAAYTKYYRNSIIAAPYYIVVHHLQLSHGNRVLITHKHMGSFVAFFDK